MAFSILPDLERNRIRHCSIDEGRLVEDTVFEERGYGAMSKKWDNISSFIGVFSANGELLGVVRAIVNDAKTLPALNEVPLHNGQAHEVGMSMEYASIAVLSEHQSCYGFGLTLLLYSAGFVFSILAKCEHIYMVMEPRRAKAMNRTAGLDFVPIGPTVNYMGGEVSAHYTSAISVIGSLMLRNEPFATFILDQLRRASAECYYEFINQLRHLESYCPQKESKLIAVNQKL